MDVLGDLHGRAGPGQQRGHDAHQQPAPAMADPAGPPRLGHPGQRLRHAGDFTLGDIRTDHRGRTLVHDRHDEVQWQHGHGFLITDSLVKIHDL